MELKYFLIFVILGSHFSYNKVEGIRAEKIIGGKVARKNQFKFIVAIMYKPQEGNAPDQNPCTGGIIDDWFIITVAHCFHDKRTGAYRHKDFYVAVSVLNLMNPLIHTEHIGVDLVIMPNFYDPLALDTYSTVGNLAVVKLSFSLGLGRNNTSLKKLKVIQSYIREPNRTHIVAGYGWNEVKLTTTEENYLIEYLQSGRSDGRLRYARVKILDKNNCQNSIEDNLPIGNMCANIIQAPDEHKGICQGDSGSPLFTSDFLIGIAINGFPQCNENEKPGIYLRVSAYHQFINNVLIRNKTSNMRILQLQQISVTKFKFKEITKLI